MHKQTRDPKDPRENESFSIAISNSTACVFFPSRSHVMRLCGTSGNEHKTPEGLKVEHCFHFLCYGILFLLDRLFREEDLRSERLKRQVLKH